MFDFLELSIPEVATMVDFRIVSTFYAGKVRKPILPVNVRGAMNSATTNVATSYLC